MSTELVMLSNRVILCHPLLHPPSVFPSIRVYTNESVLHIRWPNDWNFSFSIRPSNEYPGQISFRMDKLNLFAVQRILKNLLQHYSSKASILRHSAFFMVQLSHPYMTTGETALITTPRILPQDWTSPMSPQDGKSIIPFSLSLVPLYYKLASLLLPMES